MEFTNNVPSNGQNGFSYLWDFGNSQTSTDENPSAVTYTEPGIKGDTATNTLKPANIETGAEIRVPLFINIGDRVKVETATGNYMERVKS